MVYSLKKRLQLNALCYLRWVVSPLDYSICDRPCFAQFSLKKKNKPSPPCLSSISQNEEKPCFIPGGPNSSHTREDAPVAPALPQPPGLFPGGPILPLWGCGTLLLPSPSPWVHLAPYLSWTILTSLHARMPPLQCATFLRTHFLVTDITATASHTA